MRRWYVLIAACMLWTACSQPAAADGFNSFYDFGANPGQLWSSLYLPKKISQPATLVVALHGCAQDGRIYGLESGWSELADRFGWIVLLPEQPFFNNLARCFNWFEPAKASRNGAETVSIHNMIAAAAARYHVEPPRIFITGLSAGGAMTAAIVAYYPKMFAGAAIIAGVPFGCAVDLDQAKKCLKPGRDRTPAAWAAQVRKAAPAPAAYPKIAIWQGGADEIVAPMNARELTEEWTAVEGIELANAQHDSLHGFPRTTWRNASGEPVLQLVVIGPMRHAVPVDPGHGPDSCGMSGSYAAAVGVCSSLEIARFWGIAGP